MGEEHASDSLSGPFGTFVGQTCRMDHFEAILGLALVRSARWSGERADAAMGCGMFCRQGHLCANEWCEISKAQLDLAMSQKVHGGLDEGP